MKICFPTKKMELMQNKPRKKTAPHYKMTGTSLVELMLVSMITVFGALILFLLLSITKTKSIDTTNENQKIFNSLIIMKTITKELKESAKNISYPNWNGIPSDNHIRYTGINSYSGNAYTGDIFLENGQVHIKRVYQDTSESNTVVGDNIQSLNFTVKDQNNRYLQIYLTLKIKNITYKLQNYFVLRT